MSSLFVGVLWIAALAGLVLLAKVVAFGKFTSAALAAFSPFAACDYCWFVNDGARDATVVQFRSHCCS